VRAKERPAGETGKENPADRPQGDKPQGDKPQGDKPQGDRPPAATEGITGTSGASLDHMALIQELGRECFESARKELEQKQGAEFDHCYVGMAIGAHMKLNDQMTVFARHASGDLKNTITEGQRTVRTHLDHAKELAKKLMDGAGKSRAETGK
jgi:hypothetical protein